MTPPTPKRPGGKGLPPIYVVVRGGIPLWHTAVGKRGICHTTFQDLPGDRIVKYLPAPTRARARKGVKS